MDLHPDWKEFIELLNVHSVEYVVVGAYAVSFYTTPRNTADIDFVTRCSMDNAEKLRKALGEFGVAMSDAEVAKFTQDNHILQLGRAPYRIDILTSILGVETDDLLNNRVKGEIGGLPTFFPSKEDLIAAKQASGRNKDLDDLKRLTRRSR